MIAEIFCVRGGGRGESTNSLTGGGGGSGHDGPRKGKSVEIVILTIDILVTGYWGGGATQA